MQLEQLRCSSVVIAQRSLVIMERLKNNALLFVSVGGVVAFFCVVCFFFFCVCVCASFVFIVLRTSVFRPLSFALSLP